MKNLTLLTLLTIFSATTASAQMADGAVHFGDGSSLHCISGICTHIGNYNNDNRNRQNEEDLQKLKRKIEDLENLERIRGEIRDLDRERISHEGECGWGGDCE